MKPLSCACSVILFALGCARTSAPAQHPAGASPGAPPSGEAFAAVPDSARVVGTTDHPDPVQTDGDKYSVILENEHVRVLRYQDTPGAKTHPHYHRAFVLYALSPFRRRISFADGSVRERDFKTGDVIWMPAQIHTGENIGTTGTNVVIVEAKDP